MDSTSIRCGSEIPFKLIILLDVDLCILDRLSAIKAKK